MISYIFIGVVLIGLGFIFSRFRPTATKQITDDLYALRCGFVNFYALRTNDGVVLFDTGMNPSMAKRGLKKIGILLDSVTHIFLTHTDYDHAGGLAAFPNAVKYISTEEEQMINGQTARRGIIRNRRIKSYKTMNNGETVVVGNTDIQAKIAPGHTPGSVVYLIGNRYLASGDLMRVSRKGAILPFLWLMNMNHGQNKESTKTINDLLNMAKYILTGHTGVHEIDFLRNTSFLKNDI